MRVINKKPLWQGHYLRSVLVEYVDGRDENADEGADPRIRNWEAIERVGCNGVVVIVPVTDQGEIILIKQYRPPVDRHVVELPAGLIDMGETPEDAARRELIEETGYAALHLDFLISGPASSGASSEILTVFVASGLSFVGVGKRDESENIEVIKAPLEGLNHELARLQLEGNYVDLKVHGLINLATDFLRKKSAGNL
jgi:8-oxo-dGTP pyrophosphatase MutT (NUDIX family)